jgi:hypothetical protein
MFETVYVALLHVNINECSRMPLTDIPITNITESDLVSLIADQVAEARTIDYKRDLPGTPNEARKEFLYDISSFANAAGGHIVFGVEEKEGLPTNLVGLAGINADQEILRLEQVAREGIRPPITGLQAVAVRLASGNIAIVWRVPKSWNPPHQVIYQRAFRFYGRGSNGKYQIDVDELRSLFSLSETVAERVRQFRIERIGRIVGGGAPVALMHRSCLVLHVVPLSAFGLRSGFSLTEAIEHPNYFPPLYRNRPANWRINFDGILTLSNADEGAAEQRAYVQVFRSGIVEAVASGIAKGNPTTVTTLEVEAAIVKYARVYTAAITECGAELPVTIIASLVGVGDAVISTGQRSIFAEQSVASDRDQMHLSEAILDAVPSGNQDCATAVRSVLDQLANAAGAASTSSFDAAGNYLLRF